MDGYRHEGGDGELARSGSTRSTEAYDLQAREPSGKILHIVIRQAKGATSYHRVGDVNI